MNVFLWVLQGALALLLLSGGAYKVATRADLAKQFASLSGGAWGALGAFEIVAGVLLIVPAATGWWPVLTPWAAVAIVLESVALVAVYGRVSLAFGASNPLVFAVGMGLVAAVVAVGRFVWSPLG